MKHRLEEHARVERRVRRRRRREPHDPPVPLAPAHPRRPVATVRVPARATARATTAKPKKHPATKNDGASSTLK